MKILQNPTSVANLAQSEYDVWGISLWFEDESEDLIEFDSMINVRPRQNKRSRDVESPENRQKIAEVVHQWIR